MTFKKDQGIESLRGIAIILVVVGHVIGSHDYNGMKVSPESFWRYSCDLLKFIRMPLFTMISGYVYSMRPVSRDMCAPFLKAKIRRLIVPFVTVGSIQYVLRVITPGVNTPLEIESIWRIYFFGLDQFWFVQSLLLVFLFIALVESYNLLDGIALWGLILTLSVGAFYFSGMVTTFIGLSGFLFLLVFFLFGLGIGRFAHFLNSKPVLTFSLIFFAIGIIMIQLDITGVLEFSNIQIRYLELLTAIAGGNLLFKFRGQVRLLAFIGSFAYQIFIFHIMFSAGIRIFLMKINVNSEILIFFASLSGGILFSIVFTVLLRKFFVTRRLLLGER